MHKAAFRHAGKSRADFTEGTFTLCLVWTYLQSEEGEQNGSDRGETGAVRTSTPLGSSLCNQKVSSIKLARLTFDLLENFSFWNTQQSCWTFQHFEMNVNIDVSLASTPRESFARVQGPSHDTATRSVLDELRMNWADSYGYQSAAAKVCGDLRHLGKSTMMLNGKTSISAEQNLKIQLRTPKRVRTRVKKIKHSPILEKPTWEFILTQFLFQNSLYEGTFSDAKYKMTTY